jgi:hypothetical protein
MQGTISVLKSGETLPWQYPDTPYVKEMDPAGATSGFVRCIDPTESSIVVKVIRTKVG